jgi:hypothetical protein
LILANKNTLMLTNSRDDHLVARVAVERLRQLKALEETSDQACVRNLPS